MGSLPLRLGRSFLTLRLNSASVESTASCSREVAFASAPLSTTAEIFTIPFFGSVVSNLPQNHVAVIVPQCSENRATLAEHCWRIRDLRVTTVHPASLNASRNPDGELIEQESLPKYSTWSVSSSSSVQQPSTPVSSASGASSSKSLSRPFSGAQTHGVPNPSAHVACFFPCLWPFLHSCF